MSAISRKQRHQLVLVSVVEVFTMATWFAGAAAGASLARDYSMSSSGVALLTNAVQVGFVAGALGLAILTVPDRVSPRVLIGVSAAIASITTMVPTLATLSFEVTIALRFLTGAALAGVYPPGIRIATSWYLKRRGFAVSVLVAALTLGSAIPRLISTVDVDWHLVFGTGGILAAAGAVVATRLELGPHAARVGRIDPRAALRVFVDPDQRSATLGYFGHMWELYAFWTWLPAFIGSTAVLAPWSNNLTAFLIAGVAGAVGALLAGTVSDRIGKARIAASALAISGICCLLSPVASFAPVIFVWILLLAWGVSVIADSALFSALLGDATPAGNIGTAVTTQVAVGFAITTVSITLVPRAAEAFGWENAFVLLAVGPALGLLAFRRSLQRERPELLTASRKEGTET